MESAVDPRLHVVQFCLSALGILRDEGCNKLATKRTPTRTQKWEEEHESK